MAEAERPESVRETLEAAFDAAEGVAEGQSNLPAPESRPNQRARQENVASDETPAASQRTESESETERDQIRGDSGVDRPRDQFGRFARSSPEGKAAEPAPAQDTQLPDQPEPGEPEPAEGPAIVAPQAWSGPARDIWSKLPRPVQEEVDRRERDIQKAFQERAEQINAVQPLARVIEPYRQRLAMRGISPEAAVQQLLAVQDLLDRNPIEGIAHVARSYGVDLRTYATAFQQAQQPQDPAVRDLTERVTRQDQMLQQWRQQAEQQEAQRIDAEVKAFQANSRDYPYFEQVRDRMAVFVASGSARDLAHAYTLAVAENDDVRRQMEQAREAAQRQARMQSEKQAAERARRAAVSVSGSPYGGAATEAPPPKNESVRSSVMRAYEQVANR